MRPTQFFDGYASPIVIQARLPRDLQSFGDVKQVTSGLASIENEMRKSWREYAVTPDWEWRVQRDVRLLRFEVASPPAFSILADPAWLAVFITVLTNYSTVKTEWRAVEHDVARLVKRVQGLSESHLDHLRISVLSRIERLLEAGEDSSLRLAKRFKRLREKLIGSGDALPDIKVIDIERRFKEL